MNEESAPILAAARGRHLGLRARITIAVALVTLLLSVVLAVTTLTVTRRTLLDQREASVTRRVLANSQTVEGAMGGGAAEDLQTVLSSLSDAGKPSLILTADDGTPVTVSLDARFGVDALPRGLKDRVVISGEPAIMRFRANGEPLVGVGVPLTDLGASYFEVFRLDDIDTGLRSLALTLLGATLVTTVAAGGLGYWASRYTLTPLTRIGDAAKSVAAGQLDTRIDYDEYSHDADLAPLVANFNGMVSTLQDRIDRDARFASDVSHELRSPLTTLNAGIQVLANNRAELPDRARQALDLLSEDVERFTQLVEDLLEISRFDAGAVRLELDDVTLVPLVVSTVANLTQSTVPVECDPGMEDLVMACDKRRVVRILANFLNNADKYADGATSVLVERHDRTAEDRSTEATVCISVEDAGPGVSEGARERIFHRFNRGDQGGSRGSDVGVGLGLALAAEHAQIQGGRVFVEDRHDGGQGARFVVELPLLGPLDDEEEPDLSAATPEAAGALTLTGEHKAITIDAADEAPAGGDTREPIR